ncbi:hypothetical protein [Ferrovibrio terrae]|uniref:hypothetical protein n=1 Tax=Ferrovibrio terrae TaxID=2594003 RepID=UPI003137D7D7
MKPFPPAEELIFLVGQELSAVILNPYDVHLVLWDKTSITIEHHLRYQDADGCVVEHDPQSEKNPVTVHRLIGHKIIRLDVTDLSLGLVFDNGEVVTIASRLGPLESGQINLPDGNLIVF